MPSADLMQLQAPPPPAAEAAPVAHDVATGASILSGHEQEHGCAGRPCRRTAPLATGVERLDQLLGGGIVPGSAVLLQGPTFAGKRLLQAAIIVEALRRGVPVTYAVTGGGAFEASTRLTRMDPEVPEWEAAGLLRYVDLQAVSLGEANPHPACLPAGDLASLASIPLPDPQAPKAPAGEVPALLVIDSVSPLLVDEGAARAFPLLRMLFGRVARRHSVLVAGVDTGIHADADVQYLRHLASGVIEFRRLRERQMLHIEGLPITVPRLGWVDYDTLGQFRLTGSFSIRAIK